MDTDTQNAVMPVKEESKEEIDVEPDKYGTYVVFTKNYKKLLYDGLVETFSRYGDVMSIRQVESRHIIIRYKDKNSALQCYYDLCKNPDFMVDLPHKFNKPENQDIYLINDLKEEAKIGFYKPNLCDQKTKKKNNLSSPKQKISHYLCRKRKIILTGAIKCFMNAVFVLSHSKYVITNYYEKLITEVGQRVRNLKFNIERGFEDEEEPNFLHECDIHQLVLAQDLFYCHISEAVTAVDVLICNLPPWYQQKDAYNLVLRIVADDLIQIDWYRTYHAGTKECSFPYGVVYLKTRKAAATLRFSVDDVVIDSHKISVCLMEAVENILVDCLNSKFENKN